MSFPEKCKCGHDRNHPNVVPSTTYSFLGWLPVLFGISTLPKAVVIRCDRCKTVFERHTDAETLKRFRYVGTSRDKNAG